VGDFCVISPNAAIGGWLNVGEGAYIGAGALVREKLTVGKWAMVGMGAVVTKDVPDYCIAVGNPAVMFTKEEWQERSGGKNGG
jgi:acetyltransferase EpsM